MENLALALAHFHKTTTPRTSCDSTNLVQICLAFYFISRTFSGHLFSIDISREASILKGNAGNQLYLALKSMKSY